MYVIRTMNALCSLGPLNDAWRSSLESRVVYGVPVTGFPSPSIASALPNNAPVLHKKTLSTRIRRLSDEALQTL